MQRKALIMTLSGVFLLALILGVIIFSMLDEDGNGETAFPQGSESREAGKIETENRDTLQEEETENRGKENQQAQASTSESAKKKDVTIAWQPSHQDDTGDANWHEHLICNDFIERTISLCTKVENVKCWDTSHGLTGTNHYHPQPTNIPAFDAEIAAANQAQADYFISVHNDGGAPSGILGLCMPGDPLSRSYLEQCLRTLCAATSLPNRGIWEVRLYSLEPERNSCPVRFLLEIGDNVKDREKLMSPDFRQLVAQTLANYADSLPPQR